MSPCCSQQRTMPQCKPQQTTWRRRLKPCQTAMQRRQASAGAPLVLLVAWCKEVGLHRVRESLRQVGNSKVNTCVILCPDTNAVIM